MSDAVVKKKKSKETDKDDGKKSSKKKETETTKRSSSSKKERRGSPKKESFLQVSNTDALRKSAGGSSDFEAGVIFNRYDKAQRGLLTPDDFCQIWRNGKSPEAGKTNVSSSKAPIAPAEKQKTKFPANNAFTLLEARQMFSKLEVDGDGKINKSDFENFLRDHPEYLKAGYEEANQLGSDVPVEKEYLLPMEVISGRLLTHYDETAGVALPKSAVEQHRRLGNTVLPLPESYRSRYDRLRSLLTVKLFPRREHLLQLRRQLQNCSTEVEAAKRAIERETLSDAEQILERLRSIEAMRQSSIKHQVLQLEVELQTIERVVRRIEQANSGSTQQSSTGVLVTSAAPGLIPVEDVNGPMASHMIELIQQFGDLNITIDRLATKPLTVQTDFPCDDFPKETAERLEILSKCDQYMHAVSVKDHMLWTVIKEKERQEELLQGERKLSHEYALEVTEWAEMSQNLTHSLNLLKLENEKLERKNKDLINVLRDNNLFYVDPGND